MPHPRAACFLLWSLFIGCTDSFAPSASGQLQAPPHSPPTARTGIWDGKHGGNAGFYFRPPLAPDHTYVGTFDPSPNAIVQICLLSGSSCDDVIATFVRGAGRDDVRLDNDAEQFTVNWHSREFSVPSGEYYRATVLVGTYVLGYVDIHVVERAADATPSEGDLVIVNGQTVAIQFRIEEGATLHLLSPGTVIIDPTKFTMLSDDSERTAGLYRFRITGPPWDIRAGSIIVGEEAGGFLRRVTGVSVSDDVLFLETGPATLEEALARANFAVSIPLSLSGASPSVSSPPSSTRIHWGVPRVNLAQGVAALSTGFSLAGTTLHEGQLLSLTIPSGMLDLAPDLDVGGLIEGGTITRFHAVATGNLSIAADLQLTAAEQSSIQGEVELASVERSFVILLGSFPIVGRATIAIVPSFAANASITGSLAGGFEGSGFLNVGAQYTDGAWSEVWEPSATFATHPVTWDADLEASAQLTLAVVLSLELYGVGGPFLSGKPYLSANGAADLADCTLDIQVTAGLNGEIGLQFSDLVTAVIGEIDPFSLGVVGPSFSLFQESRPLARTCEDAPAFAFVRSTDEGPKIHVGGLEGSISQLSPIGPDIADSSPAWSPDGRRIAFVRTSFNGESAPGRPFGRAISTGIFVMNSTGGGVGLTRHDADPDFLFAATDGHPTWSPDGQRIAFHRSTRFLGSLFVDLYIMNADGTGLQRIASPGRDPNWSSQGGILYHCGSNVCIKDPDLGGTVHVPSDGLSMGDPHWSPEGRRIVFTSPREGGVVSDSGGLTFTTRDVWIMNIDGTELRRITTLGMDSHAGPFGVGGMLISDPTWSPDGATIAFEVAGPFDGWVWPGGSGSIMLVPIDQSSPPMTILDLGGGVSEFDWRP